MDALYPMEERTENEASGLEPYPSVKEEIEDSVLAILAGTSRPTIRNDVQGCIGSLGV